MFCRRPCSLIPIHSSVTRSFATESQTPHKRPTQASKFTTKPKHSQEPPRGFHESQKRSQERLETSSRESEHVRQPGYSGRSPRHPEQSSLKRSEINSDEKGLRRRLEWAESQFKQAKGAESPKVILGPLKDLTRRLISSNVIRDSRPNHLDAVALWERIPQVENRGAVVPSAEKAQFIFGKDQQPMFIEDPIQVDPSAADHQPGTFVEIRRNKIVTFGVVLQLQVIEAQLHALTLTYTGEVWPHLMNDITYSIPNFVPQDLIYQAGSDYLAADSAQTVARLKIVEQIRIFSRRLEKHAVPISKHISQLYDSVRHPDPARWTEITTVEAARHVDIRSPAPILTLLAVHTHMMKRSLYFVADPRNHKSSHRFTVRPLSHVEPIIQVNEWIRTLTPGSPFISFITKARYVMEKTRKLRKESPYGPMAHVELQTEPWTDQDLVFIRFLQNSLRSVRSLQSDPYDIALPAILKNLGLQDNEIVGQELTQQVLCDLGVLAPWDDVIMRSSELQTDLELPGTSATSRALNELLEENLKSPGQAATPAMRAKLLQAHLDGSTGLHASDPYESIRYDFGDLPVYVIDDAAAQELDDGISIEPVSGEPGCYWAHVHIADPTTVIPPGHVYDVYARSRGSTLYSLHRTWPMLPGGITSLTSLGSPLENRGAHPVITFSIKLNDAGDFLDHRVRAALVRNVQILQYPYVDSLLGVTSNFLQIILPERRIVPTKTPPLLLEHLADLRKLYELSQTLLHRTVKEHPCLVYSFPQCQVEFDTALPIRPPLPSAPMGWKGYPTMKYIVETLEGMEGSARGMVAQYMKLACRSASRFCLENGLPALRRSCLPVRATDENVLADIMAQRSPAGYVDPVECIKRNLYASPSEPTLEPRAHSGLGVADGEGYCRVTSPLRRYTDILMHWQIKNELLPASQRKTSGPLFSADYLEPLMHRQFDLEKIHAKATKTYERYWGLVYLRKYIERQREKNGPNFNCFPDLMAQTISLPGLDTTDHEGQVLVILQSLGIRAILKGIDDRVPLPVGTYIPVKISEIKLGFTPQLILAKA